MPCEKHLVTAARNRISFALSPGEVFDSSHRYRSKATAPKRFPRIMVRFRYLKSPLLLFSRSATQSGDPEHDSFVDGITEEIITALSRVRWFFVIARGSAFAYKRKDIDPSEIAHELGVRYVLTGSVRCADDRVRVSAQLIDGKSREMSGLAATTALSPTFFRFRTILHRRLSARLNLNSGGRKEKERGSSKERASTRGASISVECFISTDIPRTISRWRKSCSSRRLLLILILRQPIPLSPRLVITRWSTDLRNHPLTIAHKRSKPHKKPSRW